MNRGSPVPDVVIYAILICGDLISVDVCVHNTLSPSIISHASVSIGGCCCWGGFQG